MNHDAQVHAVLFEHRRFLQRVARWELRQAGLRQHEPGEIVTNVMVVVLKGVRGGKLDLAQVENWPGLLTRITQNQVRNAVRSAKNDRVCVPSGDLAASSKPWSSDEPLWERLDRERRLTLLRLLPDTLHKLLLRRYEYGMDLHEVAAAAGMTAKDARSMIDGLTRKVELVERGGVLRGPNAPALTAFARGVIALRNERSGRE